MRYRERERKQIFLINWTENNSIVNPNAKTSILGKRHFVCISGLNK